MIYNLLVLDERRRFARRELQEMLAMFFGPNLESILTGNDSLVKIDYSNDVVDVRYLADQCDGLLDALAQMAETYGLHMEAAAAPGEDGYTLFTFFTPRDEIAA